MFAKRNSYLIRVIIKNCRRRRRRGHQLIDSSSKSKSAAPCRQPFFLTVFAFYSNFIEYFLFISFLFSREFFPSIKSVLFIFANLDSEKIYNLLYTLYSASSTSLDCFFLFFIFGYLFFFCFWVNFLTSSLNYTLDSMYTIFLFLFDCQSSWKTTFLLDAFFLHFLGLKRETENVALAVEIIKNRIDFTLKMSENVHDSGYWHATTSLSSALTSQMTT